MITAADIGSIPASAVDHDRPPARPDVVDRLRAAGCVFAEDEARLLTAAASSATELAGMVERRAAGIPLEHLLGWAEFCGLRIAVHAGVFVPRRRTELLARSAVDCIARASTDGCPLPVLLELCCGSGAVCAVVGAECARVELYAVDVDPVAVRCAVGNLGPTATVLEGDLYAPLPRELRGRVHVLVANAPYVPTEGIALMPPEARLHEARIALDGGSDGLDLHRRIAASAASWLAPGGHLLIETSRRQAAGTAAAMARGGLLPRIEESPDIGGTIVIGALNAHGVLGAHTDPVSDPVPGR